MGRAALLLCGGFAIIIGIVQVSIQGKNLSQASINTEYANESQSRNSALSGLEMGIRNLKEDSEWRPGTSWPIDNNSLYIYEKDDHPDNLDHPVNLGNNQLCIFSESTFGGLTNTARAILQKDNAVDLANVPGAMGVYGSDTEVSIKGNPPEIDGTNYNMDGTPGDGEDKAGVAAVTDEGDIFNFSGKSNELGGDYIRGTPRYDHDTTLDGQSWSDIVEDLYLPNAEPYVDNIGSKDAPKIVHVTGNGNKAQNGAGILIIEENASFEIQDEYYGLIIVRGKLELKGNPRLYGSVIFTDNSSIDVEDPEGTLRGTPKIRYSQQALQHVNDNLSMNGVGLKVKSLFD